MSEKTDPAGVETMDTGLSSHPATGEKAMVGGEKTVVSINDGEVERGDFEDS